MFDKLLIANRGEIALRVARACRELGIRTVAVYSSEDRDSAVVRYADEAVHIGPGPARKSYLNIPAMVEAAKKTGATAVHPGYGFLSEDPDFAEVCAHHGLTFIGPPPEVIAKLGDKCVARRLSAEAGLPILPGSHGPIFSAQEAREAAVRIGLPAIIKAAAGGGGRGMRVVHHRDEVDAAFRALSTESQHLFGSPALYVERYVESARHVEVQILCDSYGSAIHLGVRDCSVQRRHQKLLEESPAPALSSDVIARMGQAAVTGARAIGYVGVGTFEFLVDEASNFYFMEANCRIQVEHPVTEVVTGIDLVQEQLRVGAGARLSMAQSDVLTRGTGMECRINMEDPRRSFAPSPGLIESLVLPGGPFVRVDTHGYAGYRMPASYDSLLAKVIVWAPTRDQAIARMDRALDELEVTGPGISTTAGFLRRVLADKRFRRGEHTTDVVARLVAEEMPAEAGTGRVTADH
jgi:acetyl-CoA carboxylase biotin carboxylase subunit